MAKTLYLFDIDGTLADFMDVHAEAYQHGFKTAADVYLTREELIKNFGIPAQIWITKVCNEKGIEKEKIPEIKKVTSEQFDIILEQKKGKLLDGVKDFLDYLTEKKEFIGIVTGNEKDKGTKLVEKLNLTRYFKIFSYAVGKLPRYGIVLNAIKMAKEKGFELDKFDNVVVIGDTPMDVESGKESAKKSRIKTLTIAVATGRFSKKELNNTGADLVLDSLKEYMKIVELIK
ncbi:MAG: HAD family hydrolase [Candidatus Woesearchaeota archaeon]